MHEGTETNYEIGSTSLESAFILRYPDGTLEVYIDYQLYATIQENQLSEDPFASMLIIDANPSSKEE